MLSLPRWLFNLSNGYEYPDWTASQDQYWASLNAPIHSGLVKLLFFTKYCLFSIFTQTGKTDEMFPTYEEFTPNCEDKSVVCLQSGCSLNQWNWSDGWIGAEEGVVSLEWVRSLTGWGDSPLVRWPRNNVKGEWQS